MGLHTWLIEIPEEECRSLLAAATIGRVAVVVDGRPEIFPVNHVVDSTTGDVAFATRPGTKLHGCLDWPWVAFEVDGTEPDGGWSVALVGRAEEVGDDEVVHGLGVLGDERWAADPQMRWVRIVPDKLTGRRIRSDAP